MSAYVLVDPHKMPEVEGLASPDAFYTVLEAPALLAGMRKPDNGTPWPALRNAGFRYVVCLTDDRPVYDPAPLQVLHSVALQDLYGGRFPDEPEAETGKVATAIDTVLPVLQEGHGVIVHCVGGTGRTGTLIGGLLCRLGMRAEEATRHLDSIDRLRDTHWPESPWQSEILRRFEGGV